MDPRALLTLLLALVLPLLPVHPPGPDSTATAATHASPVGPGWYLAVVDRDREAKSAEDRRTQRLVLVSPTGEARTVYRRPVSRTYGGFRLLDWSVDGSTALLIAVEKDAARAIRVDVATGAVLELPIPLFQSAVLDPDGTGLLATSWTSREGERLVLDRIDWAGTRTRLVDSATASLIAGRNGTVLTGDPEHARVQLLVSTSDGRIVSRFRHRAYCNPVRWWDDRRLLEMCATRLDLVDPVTGSTARLTSRHARGDYSHLDAREVGGRLYVQADGGCGYSFVVRQTKGGAMKRLRVPGAVGSVWLVDAVGDELVLRHTKGCGGQRPRSVLSRFDPVHHRERPLVVLGRHEAFSQIRVFGEVRAATY